MFSSELKIMIYVSLGGLSTICLAHLLLQTPVFQIRFYHQALTGAARGSWHQGCCISQMSASCSEPILLRRRGESCTVKRLTKIFKSGIGTLVQVAREYELEVLREKMDWMRRVEEAEDAGKFLKERAAQQAQLLEEYANEVRMAKQEAQLAQRQAQAYLHELEQSKQQAQAQPALVSQLSRTVHFLCNASLFGQVQHNSMYHQVRICIEEVSIWICPCNRIARAVYWNVF